jgi:hypothetical protein
MADPRQLDMLGQGGREWRAWLVGQGRGVKIDLNGADLTNLNLTAGFNTVELVHSRRFNPFA